MSVPLIRAKSAQSISGLQAIIAANPVCTKSALSISAGTGPRPALLARTSAVSRRCSRHRDLHRYAEKQHLGPAAEAVPLGLHDAPRVQEMARRPAGGVRRLLEGHGWPRIHWRRRGADLPGLSHEVVYLLREAERTAGCSHSQRTPHLREPYDR